MKKNINDYKETKTAIEVNSIEEFDRIKELLGHNQKGSNCFKKSDNYISCYSDDYDKKEWWINKGFTLYKANDFLEEVPKFEEGKWYKVYNTYTKFLTLQNNSLILGSEHIYDNEHHMSEIKSGTWVFRLSDNPIVLTDLSEIQQFLPEGHVDKISKLTSFPLEGCVYDDVNNLENLTKYLINRPFNQADNKIAKKDAIGIGWNLNSYWWLKTKCSGKKNYKLSDLESFLPKTEIIPEYVECIKADAYIQIGNVYKVQLEKGFTYNLEKVYFINDKPYYQDYFKHSTRESYKAQNKQKQLTEDDLLTSEIYEFDTKKLIIGEIYYRHNFIFDHVSKINYSRNNTAISITEKAFFNENAGLYAYNEKPERLATDEEKKWLKVCKNENKFISKEDLHLYDDSGLLIKKKLIKQIEEGLDLTDRWIKCIKKCDWEDINIGEYVQIKSKRIIANVEWKNKDGYYLNLKRVEETKEFELMPEGFSPYEFKIGDYLYVIDYGIERISPKDSVLQITNIEETYLGKWITYINIRTRWTGKFMQHHFINNIRKATEKEILDYLSDNYHRQNPLAPKESFFTETDKMIINGFVMGNGQIFQNNIDSEDIYIIPITKRKKEIQTITIESITNLNLNLKTIKPKQIQIIKI